MTKTLVEVLIDCIEVTDSVTGELRNLAKEVSDYHEKSNAVRVVGTTASVGGTVLTTAAIVSSIFTGGASLVALAGVGAATALTGGLTNVTTDLLEMLKQKGATSKIEKLCEKRERCLVELDKFMTRIKEIAVEAQRTGLTQEEAMAFAFEYIMGHIPGYNAIMTLKNLDSEMVSFTMTIKSAVTKFVEVNRLLRLSGNTMLRNGGQVWKGIAGYSQQLMKLNPTLAKYGFNEIGKKTAMAVAKGASIALNVVFIVLDVKSLISNLNNENETTQNIKKLISQLEEENQGFKDILKAIGGK